MSSTTQDPTKYYRTGVAVKLSDKPIFHKRLAMLGLATAGDLVSMLVHGPDSLIEAMKPGVAEYIQTRARKKATTVRAQAGLAKQLSSLSPEELVRLMALAKEQTK